MLERGAPTTTPSRNRLRSSSVRPLRYSERSVV